MKGWPRTVISDSMQGSIAMFKARATATTALLGIISLVTCLTPVTPAAGQDIGRQPLHFKISGPVERLEMIVNTSRILTTEHKIPRL